MPTRIPARTLILLVTSSALTFGSPRAAESEAADQPADTSAKPNVLLIICDDLNDSVEGFGGHPQAQTPHLDRFAATGVRFQRAYTNAPICAPSRSSLFTGVYPSKSGNYRFDKWYENPVLQNSQTLMAYFKENGYHVAGTGKLMHHLRQEEYTEFGNPADYGPFPFDGKQKVGHPSVPEPFRQIGPVDGSFGSLADVPYGGKDGKGWVTGNWKNPHQLLRYVSETDRDPTPDERNAKWAAEFLQGYSKRKLNKPFYLGVGFLRPHTPMVAPQRFFDLFPLATVQRAKFLEGDVTDTYFRNVLSPDSKGPFYYRTLKESYPSIDAGLKAYTQAYLACVAAVDECIGEVFAALQASGLADNTIVIVTSDHGYNLGEKEYVFKNSLWEESARVPLVIRAPGVSQPGKNADHPVSLIDLYPTLVDLCGLQGDTRNSEQGHHLDGHSLRPFLENPDANAWDGPEGALTVVASTITPNGGHHWSYRTARWRYILYDSGREELYDHENDPFEWTNLAESADHATLKDSLVRQMEEARGTVTPEYRSKSAGKKWDWFKALDADKNGEVTLTEWLDWSKEADRRNSRTYDENVKKQIFARYDTDNNGLLSPAEMKAQQQRIETENAAAEKPPQVDPKAESWKDTYFQKHPEADANHDGILSWTELKAHKQKQEQK